MNGTSRNAAIWLAVAVFALVFVFGIPRKLPLMGLWGLFALALLFAFLGLGVALVEGRYLGILIDARNKMSLSRFQVVMWSWLFVSAFLAVVIHQRTIDFEIPTQVLALLGISLGSGAGTTIINGNKVQKLADTDRLPRSQQESITAAGGSPVSVLHTHETAQRAGLSDMFRGEEQLDFSYIDISEVQMFFFTIAALAGYSWVLAGWFGELPALAEQAQQAAEGLSNYAGDDAAALERFKDAAAAAKRAAYRFPELSTELVAILGISHAGYLTVKAPVKTPTQPGS